MDIRKFDSNFVNGFRHLFNSNIEVEPYTDFFTNSHWVNEAFAYNPLETININNIAYDNFFNGSYFNKILTGTVVAVDAVDFASGYITVYWQGVTYTNSTMEYMNMGVAGFGSQYIFVPDGGTLFYTIGADPESISIVKTVCYNIYYVAGDNDSHIYIPYGYWYYGCLNGFDTYNANFQHLSRMFYKIDGSGFRLIPNRNDIDLSGLSHKFYSYEDSQPSLFCAIGVYSPSQYNFDACFTGWRIHPVSSFGSGNIAVTISPAP